jgi:hypothetical protein
MMLYGRLVGHWDVEVVDTLDDGSKRTSRGEWIFGWALEGRAIQDVFLVPPRRERGRPLSAGARDTYGTTLRVYDPVQDAWHITWINPTRNARNDMVGRRAGSEIVQEGRDEEGPYRWIFSDISQESFRWRAEVSRDGGKTWRVATEFLARRVDRR